MATNIRWRGTRQELIDALYAVPQIMAGKLPDVGGAVAGLLLRVGLVLLEKITAAYVRKSEGGVDAMGILWKPLSPVTLLLRRTGAGGPKSLAKLKAKIKNLPARSQRRIKQLYRQQLAILQGTTSRSRGYRNHALKILEKRYRKGLVTDTRYKQLRRVLFGKLKQSQIEQFALAQATALILREWG